MRKLLGKFRWNEQTRFFTLAASFAVLLLAALLLPLAFRSTSTSDGDAETGASGETELKAAVFAEYWSGAGTPRVRKLEHPSARMTETCRARMNDLVKRYINDQALDRPIAEGSEYLSVSDGDTEVRLCRMWLQVQGDWHNWMDVWMDADSGDLYYFYVSRECLTNRSKYSFDEADRPTVELLASRLAEDWNCRLRHVQRDGFGTGTAVLSTDSGTLAFEISCITYDALIDIKITCV